MESTLPPLLQATSGAFGSAVGNAIVFPLDLATTRLQHAPKRSNAQKLSLIQTLQRLVNGRGYTYLYSGLKADTLSTLLSNFLYFLFYTSLHKVVLRRQARPTAPVAGISSSPAGIGGMTTKASDSVTPVALGAMEELVIGILAGVTSKGITLPVSAVCVRQQLGAHDEDDDVSHHLSLIETLRAIHREEGLSGLFSALPPTIPLALLPSLTLSIHSILLRLLIPARHRAHPPGSLTFFLGALSNALATIPLYPLVLVKALSQSGHHNKEEEGSGMIGTLNRILGKEGIEGLYKGIEGQLAKGVLQQGVMMLVKQRVEEGLAKLYLTTSGRSPHSQHFS